MNKEQYAVDHFVPHHILQSRLNERIAGGFFLIRIIECTPVNGVDYVTLIWENNEYLLPR